MSLKLDVDSRPTQEDFDEKVQHCNMLRLELSNLTEQMVSNEKLFEQMQRELSEEREHQVKMMEKCLMEREVQTEAVVSTKDVPDVSEVLSTRSGLVLSESPPIVVEQEPQSSTALPQPSTASTSSFNADANDNDDDDSLNNHPKVLYEDELIVFKEKCTNLAAENVRLNREISELRANMSHFHNSWLHNFMLKYLVPVLIVIVAYIFYLLK